MDNQQSNASSSSSPSSPYPFEGCEKRLIIKFQTTSKNRNVINRTKDLRNIPKIRWIEILKHAQCSILNTIKNEYCIAHLLSESSLFVFKRKIMIKTCGTTALLNIISILDNECKIKYNLEINNIFYSRSNFMFPLAQPPLYQSFKNETDFIASKLGKYGNSVTFGGNAEKSKWHCYEHDAGPFNDDINDNEQNKDEKTLEIVMFDLDPKCMEIYFTQNRENNNLDKLYVDEHILNHCNIPNKAQIDSYLFEPCGYSLNGLLNNKYWSIHITPEHKSSFISFETNYQYENYQNVIHEILKTFRPKRFGFAINSFGKFVYDDKFDKNLGFDGFEMSDIGYHSFSSNHDIKWFNYVSFKDDDKDEDIGLLSEKLYNKMQSNYYYNYFLTFFLFVVLLFLLFFS